MSLDASSSEAPATLSSDGETEDDSGGGDGASGIASAASRDSDAVESSALGKRQQPQDASLVSKRVRQGSPSDIVAPDGAEAGGGVAAGAGAGRVSDTADAGAPTRRRNSDPGSGSAAATSLGLAAGSSKRRDLKKKKAADSGEDGGEAGSKPNASSSSAKSGAPSSTPGATLMKRKREDPKPGPGARQGDAHEGFDAAAGLLRGVGGLAVGPAVASLESALKRQHIGAKSASAADGDGSLAETGAAATGSTTSKESEGGKASTANAKRKREPAGQPSEEPSESSPSTSRRLGESSVASTTTSVVSVDEDARAAPAKAATSTAVSASLSSLPQPPSSSSSSKASSSSSALSSSSSSSTNTAPAPAREPKSVSVPLASQRLAADEDETLALKFGVPPDHAGMLIGVGGQTIVGLQVESGARIRLSKGGEYFPGTTHRVVLIEGTRQACLTAFSLMLKMRFATDESVMTDRSGGGGGGGGGGGRGSLGRERGKRGRVEETAVEQLDLSALRVEAAAGTTSSGATWEGAGPDADAPVTEIFVPLPIVGVLLAKRFLLHCARESEARLSFVEQGNDELSTRGQQGQNPVPLLLERALRIEGTVAQQVAAVGMVFSKMVAAGSNAYANQHRTTTLRSGFIASPSPARGRGGGGGGGGGGSGGGGSSDATVQLVIPVPDRLVGFIIGRSGEKISRIESASGTTIRIAPRGEFIRGTRDRAVTIIGTSRGCADAKRQVLKQLNTAKSTGSSRRGHGSGSGSGSGFRSSRSGATSTTRARRMDRRSSERDGGGGGKARGEYDQRDRYDRERESYEHDAPLAYEFRGGRGSMPSSGAGAASPDYDYSRDVGGRRDYHHGRDARAPSYERHHHQPHQQHHPQIHQPPMAPRYAPASPSGVGHMPPGTVPGGYAFHFGGVGTYPPPGPASHGMQRQIHQHQQHHMPLGAGASYHQHVPVHHSQQPATAAPQGLFGYSPATYPLGGDGTFHHSSAGTSAQSSRSGHGGRRSGGGAHGGGGYR